MQRVRIYRQAGSKLDEAALRALLAAAECQEVAQTAEAEAFVVILTPDLVDGPELESALKAAINARLCIVAIWPQGTTVGITPRAINKFGSDIIIWDAARLEGALSNDCKPHYDDPSGKPRREPETPRNC
jgi:hypothetical protein